VLGHGHVTQPLFPRPLHSSAHQTIPCSKPCGVEFLTDGLTTCPPQELSKIGGSICKLAYICCSPENVCKNTRTSVFRIEKDTAAQHALYEDVVSTQGVVPSIGTKLRIVDTDSYRETAPIARLTRTVRVAATRAATRACSQGDVNLFRAGCPGQTPKSNAVSVIVDSAHSVPPSAQLAGGPPPPLDVSRDKAAAGRSGARKRTKTPIFCHGRANVTG
jgi:hypothetical protein